ncbi:unnamed protein product [Acanthoscelides obtectus]|uniref:Uncharacterized protein n=1 Tax=Acanthoscelides obtectus TaxID=200917 RepID=A0A9P0NVK7_ACAOB|nr:unnamed protein product [Acanthoscelides obtectus]CAK1661873.1 hypothetical protein AOBTE_LOCUS22849 [Acanthoscelides obtectus]
MSDWLNEEILNFLERYQGETCIWDIGHPDYKDNKKKLAHGVALAQHLGESVDLVTPLQRPSERKWCLKKLHMLFELINKVKLLKLEPVPEHKIASMVSLLLQESVRNSYLMTVMTLVMTNSTKAGELCLIVTEFTKQYADGGPFIDPLGMPKLGYSVTHDCSLDLECQNTAAYDEFAADKRNFIGTTMSTVEVTRLGYNLRKCLKPQYFEDITGIYCKMVEPVKIIPENCVSIMLSRFSLMDRDEYVTCRNSEKAKQNVQLRVCSQVVCDIPENGAKLALNRLQDGPRLLTYNYEQTYLVNIYENFKEEHGPKNTLVQLYTQYEKMERPRENNSATSFELKTIFKRRLYERKWMVQLFLSSR